MPENDLAGLLDSLVTLLETTDGVTTNVIEGMRACRKRIEALEDAYGDVLLELGELRRAAGFLLNMKAATLTMTCVRCGAVYAKEPGVELCGPCWIAAGRPGAFTLALVRDPATETETTDEPA